jgi:3-methyladenine DNA glycosylase AlkD
MIIASLVEEPDMVTEKQMEDWASQFTYWEICDQVVMNLFGRIELGWKKAHEWSTHEHEGTKRAAFVIMARLAVSEKKAEDKLFEEFLPLIEREAGDERNDVKKGVNWALRQIGKRNLALNKKAIATAKKIQKMDSKAGKWVAADALRELESEKIQKRLEK